jgi:very-short-patch-repair endonuclease
MPPMSALHELLAVAELHRGLITHGHLTELEVSKHAVARLIERGSMRVVHPRRVYAVGRSALDFETRALASSLAAPHGWVSGVTSGRLHSMRGMPIDRLEITVPGPHRPRLSGVRVRRTVLDLPATVTRLDGMRLSSAAQCLFELSYELDDRALRSALEDSLERGLVVPGDLAAIGQRAVRTGRPGSERFRRVVLSRVPEMPPVMSRDELVLLEALEDAGLPMVRQYRLVLADGTPIHLDGARPEIKLGVEVDGPTHDHPQRVQQDKHRDLRAAPLNWQVLRPTTDDVRRRLAPTVRWILAAAAARRRLFGLA